MLEYLHALHLIPLVSYYEEELQQWTSCTKPIEWLRLQRVAVYLQAIQHVYLTTRSDIPGKLRPYGYCCPGKGHPPDCPYSILVKEFGIDYRTNYYEAACWDYRHLPLLLNEVTLHTPLTTLTCQRSGLSVSKILDFLKIVGFPTGRGRYQVDVDPAHPTTLFFTPTRSDTPEEEEWI